MSNQLVFIKDVIYHLKHEYGYPLEIYSINSSSRNLETGAKTVIKTVYKIQHAILLPRKLDTEFIRLLRLDTINNEQRQILIDAADYPRAYKPQTNDYVLIHHNRFNVLNIETYDHKLAIVLNVKKIVGEEPAAVITQTVSQSIGISQNATGTT